jgi:hypothetical protein
MSKEIIDIAYRDFLYIIEDKTRNSIINDLTYLNLIIEKIEIFIKNNEITDIKWLELLQKYNDLRLKFIENMSKINDISISPIETPRDLISN